MAKVSYWEQLVIAAVSVCVSILLATTVSVPSVCVWFFFLKLQHPKLIGRGNISKKQPTNKVKSTNKDGERNRKGRRKKEGGGSVQFSLETYRIVGAAWRCSSASIESEFLLLNSIQRYHNLKRLLLPRGFQMKPSERDFWNARSHNCRLTTWDLSRPLFPDRQVVYIILPLTVLRWKRFHCWSFFLCRCRVKTVIII